MKEAAGLESTGQEFALATRAFYAAGNPTIGLVFGLAALVQTLLAYDRLGWLVSY